MVASGSLPGRARRHVEAAERHRAAQDYEPALVELTRALAIIDPGPSWWHSPLTRLRWAQAGADLLTVLGEVELLRGRPDLAWPRFTEALRRYADIAYHESEDVSIVLNNLGVAYEKLGMLPESEAALRRAMQIDQRIGRDPQAVARSLNNLALTLQAAGYLDEAGRAVERAAGLAGLEPGTVRQLDEERSFHLMTRGQFAAALVTLTEQYEKATADSPDPVEAAHLAGNLAQAYAELQNPLQAQLWQRRAIAIRRKRQPGSLPLAIALHNLADSLATAGEPEAAERVLGEAVGLAELIAPHGLELAAMRAGMVWRLLERDEAAAAAALGERALAAVPAAGRQLTGLRLAVGTAYQELGRPAEARAAFEEAREACERISPLLPELRFVHIALGRHLLDHDDVPGAARSFDRAIAVAESMRPGSADEPGLGLLFGTARMAYHGRIQAAWRSGTAEDAAIAFHAAEGFRARTLAETLSETLSEAEAEAEAGPARPAHGEAADVLAELNDVRHQLGLLYRRMDAAPDPDLAERRADLEQRAERLRVRLRALDPRSADRESARPATLAEVQRCLDGDVTVAVYEVTDDGIFLFTVRRDDFAFTRLSAGTATIAAAVDEVIAACHDRSSTVPAEELRRLGEWLLRPLAGHLGDLAVCAGDVLAYLPFEALELDGVALAERSAVWSVPSATILTRSGARRRRRRPQLDFAGFAVPDTPDQQKLPASVREVRTAAAVFGDDRAVVAEAATLAAVRRWAPLARYLHFAMHGLISDDRPVHSGFPLSGREFLAAYQMADLDLVADLVVCSACETAKGEARAGEGTVGLAYALFTAGARAVLVSRWPIADPIAASLMRHLYRDLADGVPPAQAVRRAAGALRRRHRHPREWASFALIDLGGERHPS